jgi:hypothetical protein
MAGSSEAGNKPLGSMKGGGFFGKLSEYHLLKKGSAP